jgi:hypothetical protein
MASKPEVSSLSPDRGFISTSAPFISMFILLSLAARGLTFAPSSLAAHVWGVEVYKWIAYLFPKT